MQVKIKRFDQDLPLPSYKTTGAAAMDLAARSETSIAAHSVGYIPLNIALQIPDDHFVLIAARSSLHKRGLLVANGIGIGDHDYCGDNDEYLLAVFNFSDRKVIIEKGERVAQMLVLAREAIELQEEQHFDSADRGGFGSTGK